MYNRHQPHSGRLIKCSSDDIVYDSWLHQHNNSITTDVSQSVRLSELGLPFDKSCFSPQRLNLSSFPCSQSDYESVTALSSSPDSPSSSGDEVGISRFGEPGSRFPAKVLPIVPKAAASDADTRRLRTNHRERKRMRSLNDAMDRLRNVVPHYPSKRRLSKMETLLLAQSYILALSNLLQDKGSSEKVGITIRATAASPTFINKTDSNTASSDAEFRTF
ncbi:neurogenic differentiation factor 6-A-like [Lytechinus variegatus]|uniref:neurogenic differentiation factor 6-A-like n=1 Tax=Lytechinus variegatus TaxID=7654 RepID=UPI001BB26D7E|nr:neurogenic differentiation factor 6-A-like [Lytechinus variegatus]